MTDSRLIMCDKCDGEGEYRYVARHPCTRSMGECCGDTEFCCPPMVDEMRVCDQCRGAGYVDGDL